MNKKVTITAKPSREKHSKIIDKWVDGKEIIKEIPSKSEVRFTVVLPEHLHSSLKIKAVTEKKKLKELVTSIIESYIKAQ